MSSSNDPLDAWIREVQRILPARTGLTLNERHWLNHAHQRGDGVLSAALAILGGAWRLEAQAVKPE